MYLLIFIIILIINCINSDIKVLINDENGEYNISINNNIWLRSSYTGLYLNNQWFKSNNQSLYLIKINKNNGNDLILGEWNETQFIYNFNQNNKFKNISGTIRQWKSINAITFYFNNHLNQIKNDQLLHMDTVSTVFPSFFIEQFNQNDQRAFFTFSGMMGGDLEKYAGIWNCKSKFLKNGMSSGPMILFNLTTNGCNDSIIISPFNEFMSTSLIINNGILEYGYIGSINSIEINSINSLIIYYSSNGINQLIKQWGLIMQKVYFKTNKYRLNDLTINYLGYYTDNGAYYYYHTEPNINYQQTIIKIKENISLPIHYIQLDSWWYYKGLANGVKLWDAKKDIFPNGLEYLSKKLNNIPLILHNRYWSSDTIYVNNYNFIIDNINLKSLPIGNDSFWFDLFNKSSNKWNLYLYEQDWMNHQTIDFIPLRQSQYLGKQWLISMGKAADLFNINIQYCMALPRHILQSLQINRVTQARVSDDYYVHIIHNIPQWKIGITSILSNALGLAPFKDIFWSNQYEYNSSYKLKAKEILPDREILISTLSTGPVAFADGINYIDQQRIMKCCRQDGLILKPDQPLTMIDLLISDWAKYNGKQQGQLYSTKTILNNEIFSIIFASSMKRNYSIIPSMIGASSGLIWSYDNIYKLFTFDQNHPLEISKQLCNDNSFCLWHNSPLWILNDSQSTQISFMGEINKWTFISKQRFNYLHFNNYNTQITIGVQGVPDELVYLSFYHSKFQSIIQLVCHFYKNKLQSQLIITSTNVTCL